MCEPLRFDGTEAVSIPELLLLGAPCGAGHLGLLPRRCDYTADAAAGVHMCCTASDVPRLLLPLCTSIGCNAREHSSSKDCSAVPMLSPAALQVYARPHLADKALAQRILEAAGDGSCCDCDTAVSGATCACKSLQTMLGTYSYKGCLLSWWTCHSAALQSALLRLTRSSASCLRRKPRPAALTRCCAASSATGCRSCWSTGGRTRGCAPSGASA